MLRRPAALPLLLAICVGLPLFLSESPSLASPTRATAFTLRVSTFAPTVPTDFALSTATFFGLQKAVCSTLVAYPERWPPRGLHLVPEVAAGLPKPSRGGRLYRFRIRKGFRFSTGPKVTAASFAAAINRDLQPQLASPAASFLHEVVGADAVLEGRASRASGVRARGNTLVIRLTRRTPDFLSRLALAPFCPVPPGTPATPGAVKSPPASGPYYYGSYDPRHTLVLKRNPFYRGERPRRASQIVWSLGVPFDAMRLQAERGQTDVAFLSPAVSGDIPQKYGVNRRRFWKVSSLSVNTFTFNNERPLFRNNPALRKAINYLIDRKAMKAQLGTLSGPVTDQALSPTMPGWQNAKLYSLERPNVKKARRLAKGHTRSGKAVVLAANSTPGAQGRALIMQAELRSIGIDATVETDNPFDPRVLTRGTNWDIADYGFQASYPDPGAALAPAFDGRLIRDKRNTDVSYFNKAWVNRRLDAAAKLTGRARLRAYGLLDIDLMRREAPVAPYSTFAWNAFVSKRTGCVVMHPLYVISWGSLCRRRA